MVGVGVAIVIGVAAVTVIVVPAGSACVRTYDTHVYLTWDAVDDNSELFHAPERGVESKVNKCEGGRRVNLFKRRLGDRPDRKLGTTVSVFEHDGDGTGNWGISVRERKLRRGDRIYVRVRREVLNDGDVCRRARSKTHEWPTED